MTGLAVLDTSLHKTHEWLRDVGQELGLEDRHHAYVALRATLHALRERLTVEQNAHLGAQLPLIVRGIYYEGWVPSQTPRKIRHLDEFLESVHSGLRDAHPAVRERREDVTRACFRVLAKHIDAGEARKVHDALPKAIRVLWPEPE